MTTTTKQVARKIVEFYGAEIDDLRAFEARIKGKESFKGAILRLMRQKLS